RPRRRRALELAGLRRTQYSADRQALRGVVIERYVRIAGWGKYLPERVMPNTELEETLDTTDEWIRARTGIAERRIAAPEESTCSLAVQAAHQALDRAGVPPADLDLVIVATCTPDYSNMPATASLVQHALGA